MFKISKRYEQGVTITFLPLIIVSGLITYCVTNWIDPTFFIKENLSDGEKLFFIGHFIGVVSVIVTTYYCVKTELALEGQKGNKTFFNLLIYYLLSLFLFYVTIVGCVFMFNQKTFTSDTTLLYFTFSTVLILFNAKNILVLLVLSSEEEERK